MQISAAVVPSDQVLDMFFFLLLMDPCYLFPSIPEVTRREESHG